MPSFVPDLTMSNIPPRLVEEINDGNCVAFLGAGFSVPAGLPGWVELLRGLARVEGVRAEVAGHVEVLLRKGSAHDLDQAAQMLEDELQRPRFAASLRALLSQKRESDEMQKRLTALRGIPFRAILTTNFDNVLDGREPSPEAFREVLRPENHRWWDKRFWEAHYRGAEVIKLHGDIDGKDGAVITRRDYRRLLYTNPGYVTFLRSVMSTSTVLYLGFSFGDAYLNELRSEVLSLLEHGGDENAERPPIAFAVMNDVNPLSVEHFKRHEGMEVLSYSTKEGHHDGFLETLQKIHDLTNPVFRLANILHRKRILWVDSHPENNNYGRSVLDSISRAQNLIGPTMVTATTVADGGKELQDAAAAGAAFVLAISHWGYAESVDYQQRPCSNAERLLLEMRHKDLFSPVLIFSRQDEVDACSATALLGGVL